jgi:hypothetical protein
MLGVNLNRDGIGCARRRIARRPQRMLNEAMQTMAQQNRGGRHARQGGEANQYSNFKDFQDTKPPLFKEAVEPLEADEWLNTLEQKFRLLRVTDSGPAKRTLGFLTRTRVLGPWASSPVASSGGELLTEPYTIWYLFTSRLTRA